MPLTRLKAFIPNMANDVECEVLVNMEAVNLVSIEETMSGETALRVHILGASPIWVMDPPSMDRILELER